MAHKRSIFANEFGSDRCFGLIQYRGGQPCAENPIPEGIPSIAMVGQFDEFAGEMREADGTESWVRSVAQVASFRKLGGHRLANIVVEPGAGHFAWSDRNAKLLAEFITKAGATGLSAEGKRKAIQEEAGVTIPLRGVTGATGWCFDDAFRQSISEYHTGLTGQKDQFIRWNDGHWVDAGARFFFFKLDWTAADEFVVNPRFADVYPSQHKGRGPSWPKAGKPVGNSGSDIEVRLVGGPLKRIGRHKFKLDQHALVPVGKKTEGLFSRSAAPIRDIDIRSRSA